MKKNLVALLLVLVVVSFGLFAVDNVGFKVTTEISAINAMKLSTSALTLGTFDDSTDGISDVGVNSGNVSGDITAGYISTLSNRRTGYHVNMTATAMVSTSTGTGEEAVTGLTASYINYAVTVGANTALDTNDGTPVTKNIISVPSLTQIGLTSDMIKVKVVKNDFDKAVEGNYSGTVSFNYVVD